MATATARKKEGKRVRPDEELTGNPPVVLVWPEDGQRRRILAAEELIFSEVSATVAATPATSARLLWRGGRGRRRGSS
jgi:hypothetical protein